TDGCIGLVWTHGVGFTPQDRHEVMPLEISGGRWLTFAGWLDHRGELRSALGVAAVRAPDITDGALVRLAWERWGAAALERLHGYYSIIVGDPAARRLVAARGPLRSPPLHYVVSGARLAIATMPKGLFALGDVPRVLDDAMLADILALNLENKEASCFQGVKSLAMGQMLVATPTGESVTRFYDIQNAPLIHLARDSDYVEMADALLRDAVTSALNTVETPALALSSGFDSTSVAVTALEQLAGQARAPLLGLVSRPETGWQADLGAIAGGDESAPVAAFQRCYPALAMRYIDAAGQPLDDALDQRQMAAEMPELGIGNTHWGMALHRAARAEGRRVILNGASGNATLSLAAAEQVHAGLFRRGRWFELARAMRAYNAEMGRADRAGLRGLSEAFLPHLSPGNYARYLRWRGVPSQGWRDVTALHPDFARDMRVDDRMEALGWDDQRQPLADRRAVMALMLDRGRRHLSGVQLTAWEAVTGIQARDPLGNRRLAEFCYGIPDEQFYARGVDRRLVKRVMADRLPREIWAAPRGRQSADVLLRLRRDRDQYHTELDRLGSDPLLAGKLDLPRLRAALDALPSDTPMAPYAHPDPAIAMVGFGRAIALARFVRAFEGRND
ncbi:MAG: asparagine synthase-related protein, partial [Sphingomonas sp.]